MEFNYELISSMTDDELEMEMSLYNKWHQLYIDDGTNTYQNLTSEALKMWRAYRDYIYYVLFEVQKRKHTLKMYHYLYSDPIPKGYTISRNGRYLIKIEDDVEGDRQETKLISLDEFRTLCKEKILTDSNCRANYVIKRKDTIYTLYDVFCTPEVFNAGAERKDFYYIEYYTNTY